MTKTNVLVANPADVFGPSLQVGEQRARGLEIDVLGQPWAGISVIGSYAWTDAEVTRDTTIATGSRLPNVPWHAGSVWLTWDLPMLPGLAVGGGVFAAATRAAVLPNTFDLHGYARWDALAAYRHGRAKLAVNMRNLGNTRYEESGGGFVPIYPQAGRTVTASLGYAF